MLLKIDERRYDKHSGTEQKKKKKKAHLKLILLINCNQLQSTLLIMVHFIGALNSPVTSRNRMHEAAVQETVQR